VFRHEASLLVAVLLDEVVQFLTRFQLGGTNAPKRKKKQRSVLKRVACSTR
jgi:hypothetical protein